MSLADALNKLNLYHHRTYETLPVSLDSKRLHCK
jgi:hypothetical protein